MTQTKRQDTRSQADGYHGPDTCERCGEPVRRLLEVGPALLRLCQVCTEEVLAEEGRDAVRS